MLCKNPYIAPGRKAHGCGQCLPCRVNRRAIWAHRILLESMEHSDNAFITLTYDEQHIPPGDDLRPGDLQKFFKKLRKSFAPRKLRYFAIGEYGETTYRPHYHAALFGYPSCSKGGTVYHPHRGCCAVCDSVQRAWSTREGEPLGHIHSAELSEASARYIAGYVTKKLTGNMEDLYEDRHPEFARMSNRPGIGAHAMEDMASVILQYDHDTPERLPLALRHGSKIKPLGRYLRERLKTRVGLNEEEWKEYITALSNEKMRPLQEIAEMAPVGSKAFALKQAIIEKGAGKIAQLEGRNRSQKRNKI